MIKSRNSALGEGGSALLIWLTINFIALTAEPSFAQVIQDQDDQLRKINVVEHLGDNIPLDLTFTTSSGETVILDHFFHHGKPVLLAFYYTNCPMLCSLVLSGLVKGVDELGWTPGDKFQMLAVSMDPKETPQTAAATRDHYADMLKQGVAQSGWEFLISPENHTKTVAAALGFEYFHLPERNQYAHPAVVFILTETGKISRYLYGIDFPGRDLRLGLLEASQGRIGNTIDRIILYCYHYDPNAKGYVIWAANVMKLGGGASLLVLGLFLGMLWRNERRRHRASLEASRSGRPRV